MSSLKLVKIIKALLYCLALTPLVITPMTAYPFTFGRALFAQAIIELAFAMYLVLAIFDKARRPKFGLLSWLFVAFVASLLLSTVLGPDFWRGFWGYEERMDGWLYLFHIFLVFIIFGGIFKSKKDWLPFLRFNVLVALAVLAIAALQLFGVKFWGVDFGRRIHGPLGNPIFLATYLIFNVGFAFYLFFSSGESVNRRRAKIFYISSAILFLIGIVLTQSRGAFLGILLGASAGLVFWGITQGRKARRLVLAFLAIIALVPFILSGMHNLSFVKRSAFLSRVSDFTIAGGTPRVLSWQIALRAIGERPILGWGASGFSYAFDKYYKPEILKFSYYETWSDKPHNKFLETGAEGGAFGALLYLGLYLAAFFRVYKKQKSGEWSPASSAALFGALAAYGGSLFFAFDTGVSYLMLAVFLSLAGSGEDKVGSGGGAARIKIWLISSAALIAILAAYFINVSPFFSDVGLRRALLPTEGGQKADLEGYTKTAVYFNPYQEGWRVDLAKDAISSLRGRRNIYSEGELKFILSELEQEAGRRKNSAYLHLLLGGFYAESGLADKNYFILSEKELNKALRFSPNRQHIYFALGRLYGLMGEKEKLINVFKQAIDLEPTAPLSFWEAGKQLYFLDPNDSLVRDWLIQSVSLGHFPEDKEEFLFIFQNTFEYFLKKKDYPVLSSFYAKMQDLEPKEAKWHAQNATALYLQGRKSEAAAEIRKAIELDESYRKEGEEFIKIIEKK